MTETQKPKSRQDKAYIIWTFYRIAYFKDEFYLTQKGIDYTLKLIEKSEMKPMLDDISLLEFLEIVREVVFVRPNDIDYLRSGLKEVDPEIKSRVKEIVKNVVKKQKAKNKG